MTAAESKPAAEPLRDRSTQRSQQDPSVSGLGAELRSNRTSTLKDILCVAVPKGTGGAAQVVLSLVLIRFMDPSQFGVLMVCLTLVLLLDAVFGSAVDMAIFRLAPLYRESDPLRARQIEKAGLLLKPAAGVIVLTPLLMFLPSVSQLLFQDRNHTSVLVVAFVALLGLLTFRSLQVHFQNERRFEAYGISDLLHTLARYGSIGVLLLVASATPSGILAVYCCAAFGVTAAGLYWWAKPVLMAPFSRSSAKELTRVLAIYLPAVVAGSIASRMDLFFLSGLGGVEEAGIYGAAQMFALVPQLLGTYAAAVLSPRILPMWLDGTLTRCYFYSQAALLGAAVVVYIAAAAAMGPVGTWLLPADYQRSGIVILLLIPSGLAALVNFPFTIPLLLYTRPKLLLLLDLAGIALAAVAYVMIVPSRGAAGAAAITTAVGLLRLGFYQGFAFWLLRRDPRGERWSAKAGVRHSTEYIGARA